MSDAFVVGIGGAAGGGKSTLVAALVREVPGSAALRFDDYDVAMPSDWPAWLTAGASFDDWLVPALQADLFELKRKEEAPSRIWFEAPLGRAHRATGELIDFMVFIDTPLEVALARWLRSRLSEASDEAVLEMEHYLEHYEQTLRRVYLEQRNQVRRTSDLVVDGLDPVDRWVDQVLTSLPRL